jgi:DNA-binding IclR family transcriptional regulator
LGRAAAIINAFDCETPVLGLNDLTERTGLPRSTVHRFAEQLVAIGWLERVVSGYRIGMRLFEVGALVASLNRLRNSAGPWLQKAHEISRLSVHLGVLDGFDVVYVDKIPARGVNLPTRMGGRMPAHCTGLGKAMLAYAGERHVEALVRQGLGARTPYTIVSPNAFRMALAQVRETGVAIDVEEAVRGVACVAAPIRGAGRAIAAISITGPRDGFDIPRFAGAVKAAADGTWVDMWGTSPPEAGAKVAGLPTTLDAAALAPQPCDAWNWQFELGDWI